MERNMVKKKKRKIKNDIVEVDIFNELQVVDKTYDVKKEVIQILLIITIP